LARWAVKQTVFVLLLAAALCLPASRPIWSGAWLYLGLVVFIQALTAFILVPRSPDLLIERSQMNAGVKPWDIALAVLMGYSPVLMALAAGLESQRGTLAGGLDAGALIAVPVALLGTLLTLWAMCANRFFSGIVRIQQERGHSVASGGPYQVVRHPGYVGMLIFTLSTPLMLGSTWSAYVALLVVILTIVRTALEDRTLQRELPGYAEYARSVRYRLLPGIW
jgi:protein-S-isoprenylcysteine O-methyltransferase Ste14